MSTKKLDLDQLEYVNGGTDNPPEQDEDGDMIYSGEYDVPPYSAKPKAGNMSSYRK